MAILAKIIFLLIVFESVFCQNCQCQNNGVCRNEYCLCPQGFLGLKCEYIAYSVTNKEYEGNMTQNITLFYYSPEQVNYYQIRLNLCSKSINNTIYMLSVYIQTINNNFSPENPLSRIMIPFLPGQCRLLIDEFLPFRKKGNDQMQKLIFGITLSEPKSGSQPFSIECESTAFLSRSFWMVLIISFLSIVTIMLIASIVMVIRQRMISRIAQAAQVRVNNIDHFDNIMPCSKYVNLCEQNECLQCSICLCGLQSTDIVRKTPCQHIFHKECLDEWCLKNMTCPICRNNLQKESIMISLKQNTNIRERLLELNVA